MRTTSRSCSAAAQPGDRLGRAPRGHANHASRGKDRRDRNRSIRPADAVAGARRARRGRGRRRIVAQPVVPGDGGSRPSLRGGVAIADGRLFAPGSRQILIGRSLACDLGIAAPGGRLRLGPVDWTIAGLVSARGGRGRIRNLGRSRCGAGGVRPAGRDPVLAVRLAGPDGLAALRTALGGAATTPLDAMTEADFLGRQSAPVTRLVTLFGWPIRASDGDRRLLRGRSTR